MTRFPKKRVGWSIHIKSDKPITEALIDDIVAHHLPFRIADGFGKQDWGWSLIVDVWMPQGDQKDMMLSGSYGISGHYAEASAKAFKEALEKFGHTITVGPMT